MKKYLEIWKKALLQPAKTFKTEIRKADLKEGAMHVGLAGLVAGIIAGLGVLLLGTAIDLAGMGASVGVAGFIATVIVTPIMSIIGWLIGSLIYYVIAMVLGGKGNFTTQSYLIALYAAPLSIVTAVIGMIPIIGMLNILVSLYGLYLLTLALKEAHKFTTMKAVLVWLIPVILLTLVVLFVGAAFLAGLGLGSVADLGALAA